MSWGQRSELPNVVATLSRHILEFGQGWSKPSILRKPYFSTVLCVIHLYTKAREASSFESFLMVWAIQRNGFDWYQVYPVLAHKLASLMVFGQKNFKILRMIRLTKTWTRFLISRETSQQDLYKSTKITRDLKLRGASTSLSASPSTFTMLLDSNRL